MGVRSLTVHVTNDCNLGCSYCFAKKDKRSMDLSTAKETVDFLIGQANKQKNLHIKFFGGEPLLEFDLIKKMVEYCKHQGKKHNKKFSFSVTTNGTLFTKEIVDFFWDNGFIILFSFDGDKRHIVKIKGIKAYNQIRSSIRLLKDRGYRLLARVTVCPDDLRIVDFVKHVFEVGFEGASLCPMTGTDDWDQEDTDKAFMELADYYIQQVRKNKVLWLNYIRNDLLVMMDLQTPKKRPCGAGKGFVAITVDGKILPCHHPTWLENHVLGDVFEKKINKDMIRPFLEYKRADFIGCEKCVARSLCIGSCFSFNYDENKNMFKPGVGGCVWKKARYKAIKHIFTELYVKQKNLSLIKWVLKEQTGWGYFFREKIFDANKLDNYQSVEKAKSFSFKIAEQDLDLETGDKIIRFLNKIEQSNDGFRILKPLPPCLFGPESSKVFERFNIPKQRADKLQKLKTPDFIIEYCDEGKEFTPQMKKLRELYQYYIKNAEIPKKCENCVYRIRKQCDYAYFGF